MAQNAVVAAEGRLTDWISMGVLASSVPRDVVDEAVTATGRQAKRSDGRLPPHVMVYFAMALALFAEEDYEEVAARLTETLTSWGCWDDRWAVPTSGGTRLLSSVDNSLTVVVSGWIVPHLDNPQLVARIAG